MWKVRCSVPEKRLKKIEVIFWGVRATFEIPLDHADDLRENLQEALAFPTNEWGFSVKIFLETNPKSSNDLHFVRFSMSSSSKRIGSRMLKRNESHDTDIWYKILRSVVSQNLSLKSIHRQPLLCWKQFQFLRETTFSCTKLVLSVPHWSNLWATQIRMSYYECPWFLCNCLGEWFLTGKSTINGNFFTISHSYVEFPEWI